MSIAGNKNANKIIGTAGNDKILDYANEDNISISGATVSSIGTSGENVILTIGSNKITVVGGADKVINYTDDEGEHTYPKNPIVLNPKKTAVTLLADYSADTFDVTTNAGFGTTARTIDGSAVNQDISITGNAKNNVIIGGKGNDTLTGGAGSNVFIYANGGGNDVITNYKSGDVFVRLITTFTGS